MFELVVRIWIFIVLLPFWIAKEGYEILKKFMNKRGYHPHWSYVLLSALIILLALLLLFQYGYRH